MCYCFYTGCVRLWMDVICSRLENSTFLLNVKGKHHTSHTYQPTCSTHQHTYLLIYRLTHTSIYKPSYVSIYPTTNLHFHTYISYQSIYPPTYPLINIHLLLTVHIVSRWLSCLSSLLSRVQLITFNTSMP